MPTGSAGQRLTIRTIRTPAGVLAGVCLVAMVACGGRGSASPSPHRVEARSGLAMADTAWGSGGCALVDSMGTAPTAANADVAIVAHVHAQSVRVERAENVRASFPGQGARDTVSCVVRTNLPHPLQPGRTYHDVTLDLRILTRFDTAAVRAAADTTARPPAGPRGGTEPTPTGANP
ncbi:MAG: hypothetical protein JWM27_3718 [Gemmatimonadetes bacterium]|nr:hypothetical protein [Gemmatimonadota bacterium]